jgi:hypothetical protein
MRCFECKKEFKDGDEYFNEPIFNSPMCVEHMDELVETFKDVEDYRSLTKLQEGDCEVKTFTKGGLDE